MSAAKLHLVVARALLLNPAGGDDIVMYVVACVPKLTKLDHSGAEQSSAKTFLLYRHRLVISSARNSCVVQEALLLTSRFSRRMTELILALFVMALPGGVVGHSAWPAAKTWPPPVQLTSEQAHQRMMKLLGIKSLRPGADPNHPQAPNAVNYDEAKANPYPRLPDALRLNDGNEVSTAAMWWKPRRPQIVEDFNRDVYGRMPIDVPNVTWQVSSSTHQTVGTAPVVVKRLVGHVDNSSYPPVTVNIQVTVTTPAKATGPVPVIIEFAFDPALMRRFLARMAARGIKLPKFPGPPWQQQVLARGWGYATYIPTSVQADNAAGLTEGIIGLCNKGRPRKPDDWGALRAWAWGASRVLDYLETDKLVNAREVGVMGHSRFGKAALVAMAYDRRFAIAYISSSGMGGADLYRRNFGERLENVAGTNEYHWMAGNFLKFAGPLTPNDLPVDSHELIAMCAPRPVFISGGATEGDGWTDARGMFMAEAAASPVYELLGKRGLGTTEFPPIGTALVSGDLGFRQHHDGHTPAPNWPVFLKFASRFLHASAPRGDAGSSITR
jgi:(4-O-methyl)-D-glucuronate---lignin esterase